MRVGAILNKVGSVNFFGYGTCNEDAVPLEAEGYWAEVAKAKDLKIPKIVLDNGDVLYGCECWYAPEEEIKEFLWGKRIKIVSIEAVRKALR